MLVTLSGTPDPGRPPSGAAAEALDAVIQAQGWRLSEARWQAIDQLLDAMDAAVEADDPGALAVATLHLELAGPLRITPIGAAPVGPAPPAVFYRLNRLVHSLGGRPADPEDQPGQAGQPGPTAQDGTGDAPARDR
jgi:hypothetical protein